MLITSHRTLYNSRFELLMLSRLLYLHSKMSQSRSAISDSACVNFYIFQHGSAVEIVQQKSLDFHLIQVN